MNFNFFQPTKIHFGSGQLNKLGEIVSTYGKRCLLVTTQNEPPLRSLYDRIKDILTKCDLEVVHYDAVVPNPTTEIVASGIQMFHDYDCEVIVAVGGGSSIDTGKSIGFLNKTSLNWDVLFDEYDDPFKSYKHKNKVPLISVTTTAGTGSEVTQAAVLSKGNEKRTLFHTSNFSNEAILDPELLLTLPPRLTAATGFDAFCHAFESFVSGSNEMSRFYAEKAMEIILDVLPKAVENPEVLSYREDMMLAQLYAGIALANGGASAPHPLSEIIGGLTHMSHGEALALVFPEYIQVFSKKYPESFGCLEHLFEDSLDNGVKALLMSIGLYKTKADYGITNEQINKILSCPVLNMLPFGTKEELTEVLLKAFNR